jgi:hypothetical protein
MSTKALPDLHNAIAEVQAGPKSCATKTKLTARIESIAADKDIDLTSFCPTATDEVAAQDMQPQAEPTETADEPPKPGTRITGKGIGRLARDLLLDPTGYPHAAVAEMVNAQIEGAQATAKSVRWYACNMRKKGTEVPARQTTNYD